MPAFEPIVGRYFTMRVGDDNCRIYVEEAGETSLCSIVTKKGCDENP